MAKLLEQECRVAASQDSPREKAGTQWHLSAEEAKFYNDQKDMGKLNGIKQLREKGTEGKSQVL